MTKNEAEPSPTTKTTATKQDPAHRSYNCYAEAAMQPGMLIADAAPSETDVLIGSKNCYKFHEGNIAIRLFICRYLLEHTEEYLDSRRSGGLADRYQFDNKLVRAELDSGFRFIEEDKKAAGGRWRIVKESLIIRCNSTRIRDIIKRALKIIPGNNPTDPNLYDLVSTYACQNPEELAAALEKLYTMMTRDMNDRTTSKERVIQKMHKLQFAQAKAEQLTRRQHNSSAGLSSQTIVLPPTAAAAAGRVTTPSELAASDALVNHLALGVGTAPKPLPLISPSSSAHRLTAAEALVDSLQSRLPALTSLLGAPSDGVQQLQLLGKLHDASPISPFAASSSSALYPTIAAAAAASTTTLHELLRAQQQQQQWAQTAAMVGGVPGMWHFLPAATTTTRSSSKALSILQPPTTTSMADSDAVQDYLSFGTRSYDVEALGRLN